MGGWGGMGGGKGVGVGWGGGWGIFLGIFGKFPGKFWNFPGIFRLVPRTKIDTVDLVTFRPKLPKSLNIITH